VHHDSDDRAWLDQIRQRIETVEDLGRHLDVLTPSEMEGIAQASQTFRWGITPYYAGLMDRGDPNDPIRRQAVPRAEELTDAVGIPDPLQEETNSPAPGVIRVYPDRVAFCVTNQCATYCRFCLRKRNAGQAERHLPAADIAAGIAYIASQPEIRDVLITGGDPLMFPDDQVASILARLRAIPHVEILRLGTRAPCTLPQRVTPKLCEMLERFHPLWVNVHFNHPRELTEEAAQACDRLVRAGIPLGNQSVLLKGINDDPQVMKQLVQGLVKLRIRPYYVYQCQTLSGTEHFRVPVERGIEIVRQLRGFTTGFAVPTYVLDTPYGKVPMGPNYLLGRDGDDVVLSSWQGHVWREHNPIEGEAVAPLPSVQQDRAPKV
jgi:lysine 2,3-aminomutase